MITIQTLLAIAGGISIIAGGVAAVIRLGDPYKKLKEQVDENTKHLASDRRQLMELDASNQIICRTLLAMLDHQITGNSIEKLKDVRQELNNFLISK